VDLASVSGLKNFTMIGDGAVVQRREFNDTPHQTHLDFTMPATQAHWYAFMTEDIQGNKAYSDPSWIDVVRYPANSAAP
jgi:hypothetical protein